MMSDSRLPYVSDDELLSLSSRIGGNINNPQLREMLDFDSDIMQFNADDECQRSTYDILSSWRDNQPDGCDIRGLLAGKLKGDFPDESELLKQSPLSEGM